MAATCVRFAYLLKRWHAGTEDRNEYAIFAGMWILIEINTAICGKYYPILSLHLNVAAFLRSNPNVYSVANLPTLGPAVIWLPEQISGLYRHLLDYAKTERDRNPVALFGG